MAAPGASARLGVRLTGILGLPARLATLDGPATERAGRLFDIRVASAHLDPPPALEPWLAQTFGSVAGVRRQTVIKVTNRVTLEAAAFAPLRARRPIDGPGRTADIRAEIAATVGDPFCHPETGTPAHIFGRVRGAHMLSGANAAAADAHHAVLVFDRHDPLDFDGPLVADLFGTGRAWADLARAADPDATNYLLLWNCLWRAGGSIVHGHAQVLLGAGPHYARLERFRRERAAYRAGHGADLIADLVDVHRDLGLAVERDGVGLLAHLTPVKEREVLVVGRPGTDERDPAFADAVTHALSTLRDRLGVRSFNLALWRRPLVEVASGPGWDGFPPIVRIVDRGDPFSRPSDIGAMELYGTPIVASDPYDVIAALA